MQGINFKNRKKLLMSRDKSKSFAIFRIVRNIKELIKQPLKWKILNQTIFYKFIAFSIDLDRWIGTYSYEQTCFRISKYVKIDSIFRKIRATKILMQKTK